MLTADHFVRSGKVRDLFTIEDRRLVLVASDRISAFDVILPTEIPDKGRVLTGISRFWFRETETMIPNHLLDTDPAVIADAFSAVEPASFDAWRGRLMVCRPAEVIPIEAVVRGYLSGSGWKEYQASGTVCGISLPAGLRESDRLEEPIFTPAEKAPAGQHDRNLTFDEMIGHIGATWPFEHLDAGALAERIREAAIRLYRYGAAVAARGGVILADTKFEFGIPVDIDFGLEPAGPVLEQLPYRRPKGRVPDHGGGAFSIDRLMLIDEVMTPDSSRFWDASAYAPGGPQASFDKQFVRDWLEAQPWDKTDPGPALPADVVAGTKGRYLEAYERITGASFDRYLAEDVIGPEGRRP